MNKIRKESRAMSAEWALEVLDKAPYITVGMIGEDGLPYALPLSLARTDAETFYFHGAMEGKKIDSLRKNPNVCLTAVTKCSPLVGPQDNSFTLEFKSAMAYGKAEIVTAETEKVEAMRAICQRFLPQHMAFFEQSIERSLGHTTIVRIRLTEPPTGKRKQFDAHGEEMKYGRME